MRTKVFRHLGRLLASRYTPVVLAIGAIVVSLPAIVTGPLTDDYVHRATLVGPSEFTRELSEADLAPEGSGRLGTALSEMFVAVHPEKNLERFRAYGVLPWWTYEGYQVAFWRPLASLTHWLDFRLFPDSYGGMHLHSILWGGVVVLAVAALYRRFIDVGWIAGLAGLLYLCDDNSYFPTMWVANRNLLIALTFAALTLIFHDRWRRDRWRAGRVMAPLCLLMSLLASEAGITTFVYLFAYEVTLGQGRWSKRAVSLGPAVAVILLWRLYYNLQGYGAAGGGFYFDPVREPLGYLVAVLQRAPFMLGGQWTSVPSELYSFLPFASKTLLGLVLAAMVVAIPLALLPMLRANRRARFWLLGMYLAVLPFCATIPMGRALLFLQIGMFGVVAEFVGGWLRGADWVPKSGRMVRVGRWIVIAVVVVHGPLAAAGRVTAPFVTARLERETKETMDLSAFNPWQGQDLMIVNAPNPSLFMYEPFRWAYETQPLPQSVRVLSPGFGPVEVRRTGPRRLAIRSVTDSLFDCERDGRMHFVFFYRYLSDVRGTSHPLAAGQRVTLSRMTIEIVAVDGRGFPLEVAFEFQEPLDDPSRKWIWWDWDEKGYRAFAVPPVGETVNMVGPF